MRLGVGVLVLVVACGPGLKVGDPRESARATMSEASGDPRAIAELLHDSITLGQLIFDDATCASAFPPGEVRADRFAELARCLAGLKLRPSPREDALGDVVVLTYGPFEVEARVIEHADRSQLTWIGFASQHAGAPMAPTLETTAFEALRASGQRVPVLEAETARRIEAELLGTDDEVVMVWLKVCVDEAGTVSSVHPYQPGSYAMLDAFLPIVRAWAFRPFTHGGKAQPFCSMVRMAHPAAKAPAVEVLPLPPPPSMRDRPPLLFTQRTFVKLLEGQRVSGTRWIIPDDKTKTEIMHRGRREVRGSFRVCVDESGGVESVLPMRLTGFPAYDRKLLTGISMWKYSPYRVDGVAVPVCTAVTFIYVQSRSRPPGR